MSKSESKSKNYWDRFDAAIATFEPGFVMQRFQGAQEFREPLNALVEPDATIATDEPVIALTDVRKPL